jgi:hypothetical protein
MLPNSGSGVYPAASSCNRSSVGPLTLICASVFGENEIDDLLPVFFDCGFEAAPDLGRDPHWGEHHDFSAIGADADVERPSGIEEPANVAGIAHAAVSVKTSGAYSSSAVMAAALNASRTARLSNSRSMQY